MTAAEQRMERMTTAQLQTFIKLLEARLQNDYAEIERIIKATDTGTVSAITDALRAAQGE